MTFWQAFDNSPFLMTIIALAFISSVFSFLGYLVRCMTISDVAKHRIMVPAPDDETPSEGKDSP